MEIEAFFLQSVYFRATINSVNTYSDSLHLQGVTVIKLMVAVYLHTCMYS